MTLITDFVCWYFVMVALGEEELLVIPFRLLIAVIGGVPFVALVICVAISVLFHFEESTSTHCNVSNALPSVSASVSLAPERYIWRILINLHCVPRFAIAFAYRNLLVTSPLRPFTGLTWFPWLCNLACLFNVIEVLSLLMLSSVSSREDYFVHKYCFIGFIFFGLVYFLMATWLFDYSGRRRTTSLSESSFQYKVLCCTAYVLSLLFTLYFYYRHNQYCEPGVYTLFAMCEYAVIVFNILFHCTVYYDFHSRYFTLTNVTSSLQYDTLPMHNYEGKRTG